MVVMVVMMVMVVMGKATGVAMVSLLTAGGNGQCRHRTGVRDALVRSGFTAGQGRDTSKCFFFISFLTTS